MSTRSQPPSLLFIDLLLFRRRFTDRVKVDKAYPNQGIKLSGKNSLAVFLVTLLTVGLIGGLIGCLIEEPYIGLIVRILVGLIAGLSWGWFSRDQTLYVTTNSLADRIYATDLCRVPRPVRTIDSPEEGRWWLHLHRDDALKNREE